MWLLPSSPSSSVLPSLFICLFLALPLTLAQQNGDGGDGLSALPALSDTKGANAPAAKTTAATEKASNTKSAAAGSKTTDAPSKLPDLSSSGAAASSTDSGGLSGLPKLEQNDYPAPTVPPTADAPYMQRSKLPEGTVFICVGAALGFIAFLILAWRGLVAWSIHRSVKRAANLQSAKYGGSDYTGMSENKSRKGSGYGYKRAGSQAPPAAFYSNGHGSSLSIDQLSGHTLGNAVGGHGGGKSGSRTPASARGSLFFSPTASAGGLSHGAPSSTTAASTTTVHNPSSARASAYLPAGYYASGTSAGSQHHQTRDSIALSNLNPNAPADRRSRRYSRPTSMHTNSALLGNPSPPISPSLAPPPPASSSSRNNADTAFARTDGPAKRMSTPGGGGGRPSSTASLLQQDQSNTGRAPSAYLEDLFDEHAPGAGSGAAALARPSGGKPPGQMERENERPSSLSATAAAPASPSKREERRERRERRESRGERGARRRSRHQ